MDAAAATPATTTTAPDWSTIDREILCPLCDYNLRGLTESRCPECGHRFEWAEMLAHGGAVHPFLFEHHPERPIRSWWRTYWASRFPWSFWRSVRPTQPVNVARLVLYALICAVLTILLAMPEILLRAQRLVDEVETGRASAAKMWATPPGSTQPSWAVVRHGSVQAAVDAIYPKRTFLGAMREVCTSRLFGAGWRREFLPHSIIRLLCWPVLTMLSVLVFRISFRQAGIRYRHVARVVVYSADVMILAALILVLNEFTESSRTWPSILAMLNVIVMGYFAIPYFWIALLAWLLIRMILAERMYLRLRGGVAMVIASQVMVWLALAKISLVLEGH